MTSEALSVRDLRRRWKPHKERLALLHADHPTSVRFHRACSWLDQSEQIDREQLADVILMEQWTALNALYGRWNAAVGEPYADRSCWKEFLQRILELDGSRHVVQILEAHKPLVLTLVENSYLSGQYWDEPCEESRSRYARAKYKVSSLYIEKRWLLILEQVIERIYLLRCQLVHGAATCGSKLNRKALGHCITMLGHLLPAILLVWIDHGSDEDWGLLCYPPITGSSVVPVPNCR